MKILKLILLHETSPLSPINLSNYADFDQSKLISIKAQHGLTFTFWNGKIQLKVILRVVGQWVLLNLNKVMKTQTFCFASI